MINMTLKQLRYVDALARHRHFGHAADACAISQPALSMQIKELEAALGTPLVERGGRKLRLTAFGEEFTRRARQILREVDELATLARAAEEQFAGRLRLGVIPTIAPYLLPRVVAGITGAYPQLDVHVRETLTPRLIEELDAGRIDAAIVALPVSEPWLQEVALFDERMMLVRPQTDEGKPVPDAADLGQLRLLLLEEGHCFRDQALEVCRLRPDRPREGLDGTTLSTLVQMVGAGLGVTLLPEMAVSIETRSAPVTVTRFPVPEPRRTVGMVWRKSSPLFDQLRSLSEIVRSASADAREA
jgi:LysR family hydrogen peroxide-inducible transcriptional activator